MIAVLANLLTVALAQEVDRHRHAVGMVFLGWLIGNAVGWMAILRWVSDPFRPLSLGGGPQWIITKYVLGVGGLIGGALGYLGWSWWEG